MAIEVEHARPEYGDRQIFQGLPAKKAKTRGRPSVDEALAAKLAIWEKLEAEGDVVLTIPQAARYLGMKPSTGCELIMDAARAGDLISYRCEPPDVPGRQVQDGGTRLFATDVNAWVRTCWPITVRRTDSYWTQPTAPRCAHWWTRKFFPLIADLVEHVGRKYSYVDSLETFDKELQPGIRYTEIMDYQWHENMESLVHELVHLLSNGMEGHPEWLRRVLLKVDQRLLLGKGIEP